MGGRTVVSRPGRFHSRFTFCFFFVPFIFRMACSGTSFPSRSTFCWARCLKSSSEGHTTTALRWKPANKHIFLFWPGADRLVCTKGGKMKEQPSRMNR